MWSEIKKLKPIEHQPDSKLFRLTPKQARSVRRLVKQCCNYVNGDCLALDDGDGCVCPQSISYSLICRWFRHAVLPTDPKLETDILRPKGIRRCQLCGALFLAGSGRAKYCSDCAATVHRKQKAAYARNRRLRVDK